jgi:hypothetical protein
LGSASVQNSSISPDRGEVLVAQRTWRFELETGADSDTPLLSFQVRKKGDAAGVPLHSCSLPS